ncbi:MAG TPA: hypothetical protein VK867_10080 [Candidatus Limnocylindrales bacterium]|nr:hypothetical protein [Candidatus Limnocylindrales bacterium]
MTPLDLFDVVFLALSFGLSIVVLAIVTLIGEAIAFTIGLGRRDWESRG